jgi:hypothetical protein
VARLREKGVVNAAIIGEVTDAGVGKIKVKP